MQRVARTRILATLGAGALSVACHHAPGATSPAPAAASVPLAHAAQRPPLTAARLPSPCLYPRHARERGDRDFDVVLDVPQLCVESITLVVDTLKARVALDARIANLLSLRAGAYVRMDSVAVTIDGVAGDVLLLVDLEIVARLIDESLTLVDNHPQLIRQLRLLPSTPLDSSARAPRVFHSTPRR